MARIFLSYRRADGVASGARSYLYEKLTNHYGPDSVFMDVERMQVGSDFRECLNDELQKTDVVIVLIGPEWVKHIQERAFKQDDFVRLEIETALKQGKPVLPLLLEGAVMPSHTEVPETISAFTFNHGVEIDTGRYFREGVERLCKDLDEHIFNTEPSHKKKKPSLNTAAIAIMVMLFIFGLAAYQLTSNSKEWPPAAQFPVPADTGNFALIPAGAFTMGDGLDKSKDAPEHQVKLSGYYIGKHEVSWRLWREVRDWAVSNGYSELSGVGKGKGDTHPVHSVSWYDVVKWCNAASERAGLDPVYYVSNGGAVYKSGTSVYIDYSKQGYRLPTEAEWEKAARGGLHGKRFPWGDTISHKEANYKANSSRCSYDVSGAEKDLFLNNGRFGMPVGSFAANGYGLCDISGNVLEWCNDWYGSSYYDSSPSTDPQGPSAGSTRMMRGGSWFGVADGCRVAYREHWNPNKRFSSVGFRLALSK